MSKRLTRAEAAAVTRRQLLDAAATAFARAGFGGASVHEIAELAGKTTGALYAHFSGKEDLFLTLLQERYASKVGSLASVGSSPDVDVRGGALRDRYDSLRRIEGDWDLLAREFWLYAVRKPKARRALSKLHAELRTNIARLLETELGRRRRKATIPMEDLASLVIAMGDGLGSAARIDPEVARGTLFAQAVDVVIRGFSARA